MNRNSPLQQAIDRWMPGSPRIVTADPIGGGCISEAMRVVVESTAGERTTLFVKSNAATFAENFRCECDGLQRLADSAAIEVPQPIASGEVAQRAWLILGWIEEARPRPEFYATFGRQLAQLHRATRGNVIGLDYDNFLGSARQPNQAADSWAEFVADRRLGFQLRWATDQGLGGAALRRDVEAVLRQLPDRLAGRDEQTSLLHGDLWSGNYLAAADGRPVIVDPAVYHGCREAEFGMLRLFGGCPESFYQAYQEAWPMPDGWQRRVNVYVLYHLLNHLNLFGGGYANQCRHVAAEILRD